MFSSSIIGPDMMPFCIKPLLPLTLKNDTYTKTVRAYIDTGASYSCISAQLANELNLKPSRVVKYANNEKSEWVQIQIGKANSNEFTKVELQLTSISFSSLNTYVKPSVSKKIANLLNIPLLDLPDSTLQLLIGTDLIPSLLMPFLSTRHISLASNLHAIQTRMGYYIQGVQHKPNIDFCHNWSLYSFDDFYNLDNSICSLLLLCLTMCICKFLIMFIKYALTFPTQN